MNPRDRGRLRHIVDALAAATEFVQGRKRSDLDSDQMLLFALVRAIEIVGEAASRISPETRAEMPDVPWPSIMSMRHRLVHAYFDINRDILWTTVTEAAPPVAQSLKKWLAEEAEE
jgi:uncharacterized protein with HEPN domain